jgi:threonine synthase
MRLVKTTGGSGGAPAQCKSCGNKHFAKSGIAWHCTACGTYCPVNLGAESLRENLKRLEDLSKRLTFMRAELEHLVRE